MAKKGAKASSTSAKETESPAKTLKKNPEAHKKAAKVAVLLKHLSDPTRLRVILLLAEGEKNVGAICEFLKQPQPAVSHHLALLRHGNIISPRRQGKNHFYNISKTGTKLTEVVKRIVEWENPS